MSPFLFPFILILYGEFSQCNDTKWIARVLFYCYSITLIVSMVLPPTAGVLLVVLSVYLIGYTLVGYKIKSLRERITLLVLGLLQVINYISLYNVSYELYYLIPWYFEYSNIILREITLLCVTMYNLEKGLDHQLRVVLFFAYIVEYSYLLNF